MKTMRGLVGSLVVLNWLFTCVEGLSFRTSSFTGGVRVSSSESAALYSASWTMRDHSASNAFVAGNAVSVVESVMKAGVDLKGRQGVVKETWEKCDVDPTCCCAEQVNPDMAVCVEFTGTEGDATAPEGFTYYFAEEELELL